MKKVDATLYGGWDGGAQWDWSIGDHIRGGGEYGWNWKHPFDSAYYVNKYQETWWKYVEKMMMVLRQEKERDGDGLLEEWID